VRSPWRALGRALLIVSVLSLVLASSLAIWVRSQVTQSLPQLDGERSIAGLSAAVRVERDNLGVPTIRGANRMDVARALGFLHGQDRFFQMDLLRRSAAGELSELFGRAALVRDRNMRLHRFRSIARRVMQSASAEDQALVDAYVTGVNAGLSALGSRPFEYLLLRTDPQPWRPEDSILVLLAMFAQLHDSSGQRESSIGVMHDVLPPSSWSFCFQQEQNGTRP